MVSSQLQLQLSVADALLDSKCAQNAGPADQRLRVGSVCAKYGAIRTRASRIKYAVTSSKANCDLSWKLEW